MQRFILRYVRLLVIAHHQGLKTQLHWPSAKTNYLRSRGSKPQVLSSCLSEPSILIHTNHHGQTTTDSHTRLWSATVEKWLFPHTCLPGWYVWAEKQGAHQVIELPLKLLWGALPELLKLTPKQGGKMNGQCVYLTSLSCVAVQLFSPFWFIRS